jgi:hypothetical protein
MGPDTAANSELVCKIIFCHGLSQWYYAPRWFIREHGKVSILCKGTFSYSLETRHL